MGRSTVHWKDGTIRYVDELTDEEHAEWMQDIGTRLHRTLQDIINRSPPGTRDKILDALEDVGCFVGTHEEVVEEYKRRKERGDYIFHANPKLVNQQEKKDESKQTA